MICLLNNAFGLMTPHYMIEHSCLVKLSEVDNILLSQSEYKTLYKHVQYT